MRYEVLDDADLVPGDSRQVRIEGVSLVIIRKPDGTLSALRDVCPHHAARLSLGAVRPLVESHNGSRYTLSEDHYTIRCPWHGFEFDVDTGRCPADPQKYRVRAYPVTVENGKIVVDR